MNSTFSLFKKKDGFLSLTNFGHLNSSLRPSSNYLLLLILCLNSEWTPTQLDNEENFHRKSILLVVKGEGEKKGGGSEIQRRNKRLLIATVFNNFGSG